jgi:S-adenosylmethionine-diacylglycerol 3-amino-3-carboxypropyl transferase
MNLFFDKNNWESILYAGKWEQTFKKLSRVNRIITNENGFRIFNCQTEDEQARYFKLKFPRKAWLLVIFLLGNAVVFNNLLYKGTFPKKNIPESLHSFYVKRFDYLFKQDIARKNYFLQLLFFGELRFQEGLPLECNKEIFLKAKNGLQKTQIRYILGDAITEASRSSVPIDFLSLSDIPSYLKAPQEQGFLQEIKKNISPGGIIVNRYYLRYPENLNADGYQNITAKFKEAIFKEKIQMYSFGIYQKLKP